MVCSVMSEVFVTSRNGQLRYFAPAIVADISHSGLALMMDVPPKGHATITVRNTYFHAVMYIRNTTTLECGVRIGCEFVHRLEWQPQRMRTVQLIAPGMRDAQPTAFVEAGVMPATSKAYDSSCSARRSAVCSANTRARARRPMDFLSASVVERR